MKNFEICQPVALSAASIQICLGGDRGAEGCVIFLILDLKMANCGTFLVHNLYTG